MVSTLMRTDGRGDAEAWVDAAPFRAHLRHLMAVSGLPFPCVALLAGISPGFAHRLLHGRRGRPLRRISPDTARKLLRVTAAEARAVPGRTVPAHATTLHLRRLVDLGWSLAGLADVLGMPLVDVAALAAGTAPTCTQLVALRAAAEVSLVQTPLRTDDGWVSDAA